MNTDLEEELRQLYASVPVPPPPVVQAGGAGWPTPSHRSPRWRRRATLLAAIITAAVVGGSVAALIATRQHAAAPGPTTHILAVRVLPAGTSLNCSLPIVALSADQTRGFIVLRNGAASFQAANVPRGAYIAALHQWVDGTPRRLNDTDVVYYSMSVNPSTVTVTVHDGRVSRVVFTADSMTQEIPMGWFGSDIVLFKPSRVIPPASRLDQVLILDPSTGAVNTVPGGISLSLGGNSATGYIAGSGALWSVISRGDGTLSELQRYDLTTGAVTQVFTSTGFIEMVGVDGDGHPIIQVGSRDVFHINPAERAGITTRTLLLSEAPQPTVLNEGHIGDAGVADNLSPQSITDGDTVWMAADNGQIWKYTPDHGMQLVAKVTTSTQGPPGVAIEGPCR